MRSGSLVDVVAENEPPAALTPGIHDRSFGRRRELLEHFAVEALLLRPELGVAQASLEFCTVAALTIRFHRAESSEGTTTLAIVPL